MSFSCDSSPSCYPIWNLDTPRLLHCLSHRSYWDERKWFIFQIFQILTKTLKMFFTSMSNWVRDMYTVKTYLPYSIYSLGIAYTSKGLPKPSGFLHVPLPLALALAFDCPGTKRILLFLIFFCYWPNESQSLVSSLSNDPPEPMTSFLSLALTGHTRGSVERCVQRGLMNE